MSGSGKRVWIDLDNTPHVPFFIPIARELEERGHTVLLTARDAYGVCDLADELGVRYIKIGRHYGKNLVKKVLGLLWRSVQLTPFCLRQKPDLALSHGSRSQILLCNLLRIPTIAIDDYEHGKSIPFARPKWLMMPDALTDSELAGATTLRRYYHGIKEDVYVPEFQPDPSILDELGLRDAEVVVTVRPPASQAHYHNPEGSLLLVELMSRIVNTPGVRAVFLPRTRSEGDELRVDYPGWFEGDKTIIPSHALNGLNLLWYSDLAVSGGGTMNREAASLGIPVYSIFRGKMGAVDRKLEQEGRLTMIGDAEAVRTKIKLTPRDKGGAPDASPRQALLDILRHLEEILRVECGNQ